MADSVVTFLLAKLSSLLAEELKVLGGVKGDLVFIKDELDGISLPEGCRCNGKNTLEQGLSSHVVNNAWYDRQGDALLLEEAELVGTDKPKQLINWLLDGDSPLKVISVEGMGGLGKTTLVKKVYEDKKVKRHFQNHAWITVSQFKIEELLKDLIQQLFNEVKRPVPEKLETMDNNKLKAMLKEFLQESRYVLVLDDVWSVDVWDAIKIALPNSNCGSRVLLTMRIGSVASISCREFNGYIHKMEALSKEESWTLFCKKTFQEKDCPPHLKELSESIPQRCEGLPLAIVAIAGVLASKDHGRANGWDLVNRSIGAEVEGNYMTKILLLSYNDLPYYLKSCFLYLSSLPKNHMIEWMSSIRLWIAEGFVEVKQGKTPEEVALYELLNRSLMQVAEKRHDGSIKRCRIHDLFREIILSKSRDQNFQMIAGERNMRWPEKVRRLSIHNTLPDIPEGKCFSQLRSLLVFGVHEPLSESSMPMLFNGNLRLLKVLHLRGASLETFPGEVIKLFHLSGSTIVKEIGKLTQLRRLGFVMLRKEDGVALCFSIENLNNLHSLDWSKLRDDLLQPLQYLPNLIRLTMGQDAYEGEGLCFKASGFQRLKFLSFGRLEGLRRLTVEKGTMPRLEELFIYSCNLVELPFGIEHLSNLNNLTLSDMPDTLIAKLNPEKQSEDYWKIAHIRLLWIGDSKDGHWRGDYL
ncbi:hypothetical protein TEA_021615 [Camellia sinensis var. sinensis]|uniref:Uncharacterized protein n=1 Tax=Camellia sinensis var. sinensis TaxID=542762 RepID=A0A4S4EPS7_CAMSN|nr:hypothetical protein TEA_021615 [Camellia sinensis var. sinensis]